MKPSSETLSPEIDATAAMVSGLGFLSEGVAVAERLGLEAKLSRVEVLRRSTRGTNSALQLERLLSPHTKGHRVAFVLRRLFPPPARMREALPLARRGGLGLALAYLLRPVIRLPGLLRGLVSWIRAARAGR